MKAMILAAGRGERMRPLTDRVPKALLEAGGRPLVAHLIEHLARSGYTELVVNVSHLADTIERALGDGSRYGARIVYSREAEPLETGGGSQAREIKIAIDVAVDHQERGVPEQRQRIGDAASGFERLGLP